MAEVEREFTLTQHHVVSRRMKYDLDNIENIIIIIILVLLIDHRAAHCGVPPECLKPVCRWFQFVDGTSTYRRGRKE